MTQGLMKPASPQEIDACTAALAVAFQRQIDAATIRVYREAMEDLPIWAIREASLQLRRKGGAFFPTAPEWHKAAELAIQDQTRRLIATKPDIAGHECEVCRDTGWCDEDRDGKQVSIPCSCRPTNANYQRMTKASRKSLNEEVKP